MNLCRCEKGHFYDKEKYATCPHCAGGSAADSRLTEAFTEDVTAPITQPNAQGGFGGDFGGGFPAPSMENTEDYALDDLPVPGELADDKTIANYGSFDGPTEPLPPVTPFQNQQQFHNQPTSFDQLKTQPMLDLGGIDDGHTIGFYDDFFEPGVPVLKTDTPTKGPMPIPTSASAPAPAPSRVSTPCVGWLIALCGSHIGQDFRLKVGKNFVGRASHMDVALTEDMSVSRDRHAIVVYEPKAHLYLVQPGESSSLVYKNDEVVLTPMKLEAYDVVTVGDVNLLFMPLCGARFNWGDLLRKRKIDE